ncbi:hypothetical protein Vadar_011469 [Vaccinium darrowii]|uniref:Uncharacterized protein n=1 Tax=Vaccinium darrowii TaxID=229202 RepID=A0ACB7ZBZ8_9ERIC|nr:hypothetical protein Vadar_011469 [Vaccinium darrowii]
MSAKFGWRLLEDNKSLVSRVLKAKYHLESSFLEARCGSNSSWAWRSIWEDKAVLQNGLRWRIGWGQNIGVADDPWLPRPMTFKPWWVASASRDLKVRDLIDEGTKMWQTELVKEILWEEEANEVLAMPLPLSHSDDRLIWHFTPNGLYSVKSGYEVALFMKRNGKKCEHGVAVNIAIKDVPDFLEIQRQGKCLGRLTEVTESVGQQQWTPPTEGAVKLNFDAGLDVANRVGGPRAGVKRLWFAFYCSKIGTSEGDC